MEWVQAVELSFFKMRNLDIILKSRILILILLLPQSSRQAGMYDNFISTTTRNPAHESTLDVML